jgi:predicted DNA binding CopG/RHH family protein
MRGPTMPRKAYFREQVNVPLATDTYTWVQQRADAERLPVGAYMRRILEREATRDLQAHGGDHDEAA